MEIDGFFDNSLFQEHIQENPDQDQQDPAEIDIDTNEHNNETIEPYLSNISPPSINPLCHVLKKYRGANEVLPHLHSLPAHNCKAVLDSGATDTMTDNETLMHDINYF